MRDRPLRRPFPHRLLEQRYRRHQIEHPASDPRNGFCYAERCKGLARPAGHDQLAAILRLEASSHVVERGLLMGAQAERLAPIRQRLRFVVDQIGPVKRSAREIAEAKHGAGGLQWSDCLARIRPPPVTGINHDAGGEGIAGRGGDERIEMGLRNPRARCVALALNGTVVAAFALLGDQIDASIGAIESRPYRGPLRPQPDLGEALLVNRVLAEVRLHQPLEEASLVRFGIGNGSDMIQRSLKTVTQSFSSLKIQAFSTARLIFSLSLLSVDLPYLFNPLLQHRAREPVPIDRTTTVTH